MIFQGLQKSVPSYEDSGFAEDGVKISEKAFSLQLEIGIEMRP